MTGAVGQTAVDTRPERPDQRRTVLVSGATGAVGSAAAARLLRVLGPGDRVVLLGRDAGRLAATAAALADGRDDGRDGDRGDGRTDGRGDGPTVTTALLDLAVDPAADPGADPAAALGTALDTALADGTPDAAPDPADRGTTVLINAVGPSSTVTVPLAQAALSRGLHVVDPGGSARITAALDGPARRAGRTVLLGAGVQPGLTGAMLAAALRLVTDPTRARAEIAVGGRQPLTAATLREYMDSLSADGGWPGAVWRDGAVVKEAAGAGAGAGAGAVRSAAGWRPPEGASLSVHLDEEYVDLARSCGLPHLRGVNVMDAPGTVRELRRVIAGEATVDDVATASRREAGPDAGRYFRIAVRVRSEVPVPDGAAGAGDAAGSGRPVETVTADHRCTDSYRVTGELAVDAALTLLAGAEPAGARWAAASGAAAAWTGGGARAGGAGSGVGGFEGVDGDDDVAGVTLTYDLGPVHEADDTAAPDTADTAAPDTTADTAAPATAAPDTAAPRGAVVVGAGFGARYADALARPGSPAPLTAVVGTGGRPGRDLARDLGVRYLTTAPDPATGIPHLPGVPRDTAAAVVAVRSGMIGGQGDDLAAGLLRAGVPVLQELPVDPGTVTALTALAREHGTAYRVTGFYEHLGPGRAFIDAVRSLTRRSTVTHVLLRTSHQVLDRAGLLLAEALGAVPVGDVQVIPGAGPGRWLISGTWGRVPVDVVLDHRMDPRDPDNHSQPVAAAVVETTDGELTWDGVGSRPRWSQRPHVVDGRLTDPDGAVAEEWGRDVAPDGTVPPTWGEVVDAAWPEGVHRAVAELVAEAAGAGDRGEAARRARRTVFVLRWWLRVSSALPAPVDIRSTPPVRMVPPGEGEGL
ncbi:Gfo/Idh/MocA family oxidoreductase [Corynebacterium bovis]|uniref:Thiazolinyl imide reductase n=6 Tax=Corynebacterium bovis TaxID=36808 RepID=A0A8H9Y6P0_9CORY|nr:Gfo/Idh/MocA family oxidoreductase [Corynebacterium bovis]MBB3115997.1 thiazolinyl imide reductase [Corynebacterium bovis DSM 20582 = CIP 54.80]QQC46943.1 Gfo/Idh/MocA family oxidoreductase [Corynebacterium bovis]WJY76587.1 Saccharopine dehydrogenase [Corynebacterium bovis DSM 20582 = CIP 54.80]